VSYQVLARKYRPYTFAEMVGQQHVLKALINALEADRLHHAYLFAGTRGVGKTTIGRILAKCLNCAEGVTSKPCGVCASCVEIAEGRSVDLIEVDAASQRGVDETQQMLENVQYLPTRERFKVYLIDEVHMLTTHSFNALLKTLEEPPPHVKFLLATTEPKRLPVTVLSRCLQFNLKNMTTEEVVGHLRNVLQQEGIEYDDGALWLLGRAADGSMRDALSLTDQAIAYSGDTVGEQAVRAMLGAFDHGEVQALLSALVDGDANSLLNRVAALSEYAPSYEALLDDLLRLLHRIALGQYVPGSVDNSEGDGEAIAALVQRISPEDVQLYYQIGIMGQRDLPLAPEPRSGFEMILLRMLAFTPDAGTAREGLSDSPSGDVPRATPGPVPESAMGTAAASPPPAASESLPANPDQMGPVAKRAAQLAARGEGVPKPEPAAKEDGSIAAASQPEVDSGTSQPQSGSSAAPSSLHSARSAAVSEFATELRHNELDAVRRGPKLPGADLLSPPLEAHASEQTVETHAIASENRPEPEHRVPQGTRPNRDENLATSTGVSSLNAEEMATRLGVQSESPVAPATARRETAVRPAANAGSAQRSDPPGRETRDETLAPAIAPSEPAVEQQWFEMVSELEVAGVTQVLASHCYLVGDETGTVHLRIEPEHATLMNRSHERRIADALGQRLGGPCQIEVSVGPVPGNTPAMLADIENARAQARAVEAIEGNDNIRALLADFDGTLLLESIKPGVPD
jgi:DNA polymerase-3 subunit gamma/tau